MKIALISDTHIHSSPYEGAWPASDMADVVVLAGDIGTHTYGLSWAAERFSKPVIYVSGNHEYYFAHLGLLSQMRAPKWKCQGVHFLERETIEIDGVRILGCTLWSDFKLYGRGEARATAMAAAGRYINDYKVIRSTGGKTLKPLDTQRLHQKSVAWLDEELSTPFSGKTVVVTHFAPHPKCVAPIHEGSELSPYFVTDLSWLMKKHRIDTWCYGHTHTNLSFEAENGCRVVSNQMGYPFERAAIGFDPELILEV